MSTPYTLDDTLRIHDRAFSDFFAGCLVDYGVIAGTERKQFPVLRAYASPDRMVAAAVNELVAQNWIAGSDEEEMRQRAERDWSILPLPFLTLERDLPLFDPTLANVPGVMRTIDYSVEGRVWRVQRWPSQYRLQYRCTLWSTKKYTQAYFVEWLFSKFGPVGAFNREVFVPVMHVAPWGEMPQSLTLDSSVDLSTLEGEEQRYIRNQHQFSMRMWFMHAIDPAQSADPLIQVQSPIEIIQPPDNVVAVVSGNDHQTGNLFVYPSDVSSFQTQGDAVVADAGVVEDSHALAFAVSADSDFVTLAAHPVSAENATELTLLTISFRYTSTASFGLWLLGFEAAGVHTSSARRVLLEAGSAVQVNLLLPHRGRHAGWLLEGVGQACTGTLWEIDIRQVFMPVAERIAPAARYGQPSRILYEWAGLMPHQAYVFVGVFPSSGVPVQGDVIFDNGPLPQDSLTMPIDTTYDLGCATLLDPWRSTARLNVPDPLPLADVFAWPYACPYGGRTA